MFLSDSVIIFSLIGYEQFNEGSDVEVLLIGAVACMTALILSAWLMTFARWFPVEGIDGEFLVDYKTMIRAHIDYALMALFNLGFYSAGVDLPIFVRIQEVE